MTDGNVQLYGQIDPASLEAAADNPDRGEEQPGTTRTPQS